MWFCEIYLWELCIAGTATGIARFVVMTIFFQFVDWRRSHFAKLNWALEYSRKTGNKVCHQTFQILSRKAVEKVADRRQLREMMWNRYRQSDKILGKEPQIVDYTLWAMISKLPHPPYELRACR